MLDPSHLADTELETALRAAPPMLRHPIVQQMATTALLERLPAEDPIGVRRVMQSLSVHGSRTAERTAQVLQLLSVVPSAVAREMVALLPQTVGDTDEEMALLVEAIKELIASDRTLMLPAIGALGEVALPEALKPELARLALGALPLADEPDLPTLVRCVLGAVGAAQAGRTLRGLRSQLGSVSTGTLALLLQVIGNILRVNGGAVRALLAQCAAAATLSQWDALLLLLLLPMARHSSAVRGSDHV